MANYVGGGGRAGRTPRRARPDCQRELEEEEEEGISQPARDGIREWPPYPGREQERGGEEGVCKHGVYFNGLSQSLSSRAAPRFAVPVWPQGKYTSTVVYFFPSP